MVMLGGDFEQVVVTGSGVVEFVLFIAILWFVLCVILFFKVWVMTNDVSKIKYMLKEWLDLEHPFDKDDSRSEEKVN